MEILKINENKKLEIYDMKLNLERARRFREEQCEKIKFLKIEMNCYADFLHLFSPKALELLYHPCCCDLILGCKNLESIPDCHISIYSKENLVAMQKDFLMQYVLNGLNQYPFQLDVQKFEQTLLHAYLFLDLSLSFANDFCFLDHVVSFPSEVIALYLLEHGEIKTATSFLEPSKWENIVDCFDFLTVSPNRMQMVQSYNNDNMLLDDFIYSRKKTIALHKNIVQYMDDVA